MTEMQASIGRVQLTRLPEWHAARRRNAEAILSAARECPVFRAPVPPAHVEHAWYKGYVFLKPSELRPGWGRDRVLAEIDARGVPCSTGTCSEVYLEKAFDNTTYRPAQRLPVARELGEFMVHPTLTPAQIEKTCDVIREVGRMAHA
jgi:dTDP-4-amino-4,6-dideoxygalactose transaminase